MAHWMGDYAHMKVIVGLGNPGKQYEKTRHNVGFMVLQRLRRELTNEAERKRFKSVIWEGAVAGEKTVLAAPQTFMNLSGDAVREIRNWYHVALDDLLVLLDGMGIPFGTLRLRTEGSA